MTDRTKTSLYDGSTRRQWLSGAAAVALSAGRPAGAAPPDSAGPALCIFSKHLQHLTGYAALARTVRELGIPGVDLTARPGGHVLPENAARDLPLAVGALRQEGRTVPMITTNLLSVEDPAARPTLETAGKLGIPFFKPGYYRYGGNDVLDGKLRQVKRDIEGLARLAAETGVAGGFHNHSGAYVGAALWDQWWALRDADARWMGFYFDVCHATIEGGQGGWRIGFQRLVDRVRMVAVKDFYWEKRDGRWAPRMCPLGEGMVDFPKFFGMLAAAGFRGPISLHLEYDIEAPTKAAEHEKLLQAIERDFQYLSRQTKTAFG